MGGLTHQVTVSKGRPHHAGPLTSPSQLVAPVKFREHTSNSVEESKLEKVGLARDTKLQSMESWVKYAGIFDMQALYMLIVRWFEEREFELYETLFKAKLPELEIRWDATKKVDAFRMDRVNIHLHFHDVKDVEVERNGAKVKLQKARVRIWTWPEIVTDYPDVFGQRKFTTAVEKKLLYFMNRYMLRRDIELREIDRLYYELWGLHAQIKAFFDLEAKGNAY